MTPDDIARQRQAVIAEALSWVGTPFHHEARVRGAGVDCGQLIIAAFNAPGLIPVPDIGHYPADWHMHRDEERYIKHVLSFADEMPPPSERRPLPGDIAVFRFGRTYSHGVIVYDWPKIIHAYVMRICCVDDLDRAHYLKFVGDSYQDRGRLRPMRVFSLKAWC